MDASSSAALAAAAPKADDASTSTSATKRKAYNVLNLVLHAGRDLLVMDTKLMGKGSSDPQVKLAVGSEKFMSTCKKQNLNPAWDETFQLAPPARVPDRRGAAAVPGAHRGDVTCVSVR